MNEHERCLASIDELMPLMLEQLNAGRAVKLSPTGVSMLPMLRQGRDCVILSPPPSRLRKYDIPLYRRPNGQYVLHRVVKIRKNDYTCIGDHQFSPEHGVTHEQVIAVVTGFTRDDRAYTVDALSYRVYCRLWHWTRFPRRVLLAVGRRVKRLLQRSKK